MSLLIPGCDLCEAREGHLKVNGKECPMQTIETLFETNDALRKEVERLKENYECNVSEFKFDIEGLKGRLDMEIEERDKWRGLAEKLLERMKLINGPESKCVYAPCNGSGDEEPQCANHALIREVEAAKRRELDENHRQ